jgi:hypothetical protein
METRNMEKTGYPPSQLQYKAERGCLEVSAPALHSAYGITVGKLEVVPGPPLSCGVIIVGWPTWCFGLHLRGWGLRFIIHKGSHWLTYLSTWFPTATIVDMREVETTVIFNTVNHWFSDVEPPRKLGLWHTNAKSITSLRRIHHLPASNWKMEQYKVTHLSIGGVTDGSWMLYHYVSHGHHQLQWLNSRPLWDLKSVMKSTIEGRPCPPPLTTCLASPSVVELRPNTFHGSGILPWQNRNCFVITPSVFSPTSWVRRWISDQEWSSILDLPGIFLQQSSSKERRYIIEDTTFLP